MTDITKARRARKALAARMEKIDAIVRDLHCAFGVDIPRDKDPYDVAAKLCDELRKALDLQLHDFDVFLVDSGVKAEREKDACGQDLMDEGRQRHREIFDLDPDDVF